MSASSLFFFNDTATTEIYTLSLHDALPIWSADGARRARHQAGAAAVPEITPRGGPRAGRHRRHAGRRDRKSTRLNSSPANISYAVFCLRKKKKASDVTHSPTITS